ncbi:MAG TPA: tetratricopeptide repeat protein [Longimicrobiaceae bacterium]|nr:tetratricopeptide repeat protein [Longimicrobiaceae bacterium]
MRGGRRTLAFAAAGVLVIAAAGWLALRALRPGDGARAPGRPAVAGRARGEFVGAAKCATCHQAEYAAWKGSQHSLAMQEASDSSVLGDFGGATFAYAGVTTTFFRKDGGFRVRTDGPDGTLADFEVKYTFGVYPLQQYLISMPGGRLQALSIAWDARPKEQGGQRWFHLYPGQGIEHTSDLHWTGLQQNWNFMCADCHSTNVRKGYDAASNEFHTTWSEIDVSCEACHGPGSRHVQWAKYPRWLAALRWKNEGLTAQLDERRGVRWTHDPATGQPRRSEPRRTEAEVQVCAQCHSRRAQVAEGYVAGAPLLDYYLPSVLLPGLYYADGQQKDEVYTYGSFLQSRMFHAGVTCSDCHDPHTQKLRATGNPLCTRCHSAARYDRPAHHHHPLGSVGAQCVSCHMPATTYMQIDARRDHSIRVPRPDQSVALGVPNACNRCHTDRSAQWAVERLRGWYGHQPSGFQHFAAAFHAAEEELPGADSALAAVFDDSTQPAFVHASALARMAERTDPDAVEAALRGLDSPDPQVRHAALTILERLPPEQRVSPAVPLLSDSSRAVRMEAAWVLAPVAHGLLGDEARAYARASEEFVASQRYNADRPESRVTLGTYFALLGRLPEAEAEFRSVLHLFPRAVPAYVNLADLYRSQGRESDAEQTLREGLAVVPQDPSLHYALGLSLARAGRVPDAVAELARAATLGGTAEYAYAYAVALNSSGRAEEAIRVLEKALARAPGDPDLLFALATFHRDAGDGAEALRYAEALERMHPSDARARALVESLSTSR